MTRDEVANICKAMSDSNRLKIIEMLTQGEKCGCNLLEELQVTQPTLSHHMKVVVEQRWKVQPNVVPKTNRNG